VNGPPSPEEGTSGQQENRYRDTLVGVTVDFPAIQTGKLFEALHSFALSSILGRRKSCNEKIPPFSCPLSSPLRYSRLPFLRPRQTRKGKEREGKMKENRRMLMIMLSLDDSPPYLYNCKIQSSVPVEREKAWKGTRQREGVVRWSFIAKLNQQWPSISRAYFHDDEVISRTNEIAKCRYSFSDVRRADLSGN